MLYLLMKVGQGTSQHFVCCCLHAVGLADQHEAMAYHNHLIQLDDLAYEGLQRLQTLFGTVVLHRYSLLNTDLLFASTCRITAPISYSDQANDLYCLCACQIY